MDYHKLENQFDETSDEIQMSVYTAILLHHSNTS